MKLVLHALLWISVCAITQEQVDALSRWGLCPYNRVATENCDWSQRCFSLQCIDGNVTRLEFDKDEYLSVNATDRLLWANFPEMREFTVYGGLGPATVALHPELSLMPKLSLITFYATVTGTIPTELGLLTQLRSLELKSLLSGTIPEELAQLPLERFELSQGLGSALQGPIPSFTNASLVCRLSHPTNDVIDNPNLFCACNGSCAPSGSYNLCSVPCGRISTAACNEAVATLRNGYVCLDACRRCGSECFIVGNAYRCPGDPTNVPPPATESSRTTPTIDGDDESLPNTAVPIKLFA